MGIEIAKDRLVVAEGIDEEQFLEVLGKNQGISNIQVLPIGGKTKLKAYLGLLTVSGNFDKVVSLGVIRDADDNPQAAFDSVLNALRDAGLPIPNAPEIFTQGKPRVGVFIMPGRGNPGALEDLCIQAVMNQPAYECVTAYFSCLQSRGLALPRQMGKAEVQTFLASRSEVGKRLGEAAQPGYWPLEADTFENLNLFLKEIAR